MVNAGAPDIKISKGDGWCVRTKDGSDSAQCEVQMCIRDRPTPSSTVSP